MNTPKWIKSWFTYENGLLILLGFIFGIVFFDRNAVSVLTPFIVQDLDLNNTQLGMLSSGLALAWAFSAYIIGAWSDRSGAKKPFLIIAIIVFSLCSVLSGIAGSFIFLLLARVVMGIAEGPFLPICLSIMNVESTPKRRGVNAGIMQNVFASLLGTTLAPVLLVFLAEQFDWRVAFFITGIPGLLCAILVWKFVREPKIDDGPIAAKVEEKPKEEKISIGIFEMLREHNIRICALISCCMVGWYITGLTFLPVFFTSFREFTPTEMGTLMAMIGFSGLLGGVLIPALSDRIGRKPTMIMFCFISAIAPLSALYFDGSIWTLRLLVLIGFSGAGVFPIFMGVIPGETVSRKYSATAMGLIVCIGELVGGSAGPLLAGWAADQTSLATPVLAIAVSAICAGFLSFFLVETAPRKVAALQA